MNGEEGGKKVSSEYNASFLYTLKVYTSILYNNNNIYIILVSDDPF